MPRDIYAVLATAEMDPNQGWKGFVVCVESAQAKAEEIAARISRDGLWGDGPARAIVLRFDVDSGREGLPLGDARYGSGFTENAAREWEERERYRRMPWRKHPNADRARTMLATAIARGDMPPARERLCADCGHQWTPSSAVRHEYHHHRGYEPGSELDVVPLCKRCHAARHRHTEEGR